MTVVFEQGVIRLGGHCRLEEAEELAVMLAGHPGAAVDVAHCDQVHGAVFQALLSFRPPISGEFKEPFARLWLQPLLTSERGTLL